MLSLIIGHMRRLPAEPWSDELFTWFGKEEAMGMYIGSDVYHDCNTYAIGEIYFILPSTQHRRI